MSTTTVFESPTALGAKIITISTTITNTSGAYSAIITDERLTASMKAIKLELGDPSVFDAVINVAVNNGSLTISCASVTGTSTAVISVLKTCDDPTAITTTEFDVLANRIGDLDDLETTAKTDLVSAVNENSTAIAKLNSDANLTNDVLADAVSATSTTMFKGSGSSYTGSLPSGSPNSFKWSTFFVNINGTIKTVIAHSQENYIYTNVYDNGSWSGWRMLISRDILEAFLFITFGTNTGETGTSTVQFQSVNRKSYLLLSGNEIYSIYVVSSTSASAKRQSDGETVTVTSNGNYNFTIGPGLTWYQSPAVIGFARLSTII